MKGKTAVVIGLVSSFALWGVLEALADNRFTRLGVTLSLLHAVLISGCIVWWAALDRRENGARLTGGWVAALVLLGFASVPFYLYKHRPSGRRWRSIGKGFGLLLLAVLLYVTTYTVTGIYDA